MRKSCFNEAQSIALLKQADAKVKVVDLCRRHGISAAMFCKSDQSLKFRLIYSVG